MCLAIVNKKGILPKEYFVETAKANNHGFGIGFAYNGQLFEYKELTDIHHFYHAYKSLRKDYSNTTFLIHFRMATHGSKGMKNVHPFFIDGKYAIIHNGIIDIKPTGDDSDTAAFAKLLEGLPNGWVQNYAIRQLIESAIGYSKIALLDTDGHVTLFNGSLGHWDKHRNNWYSNRSYLPPPPPKKDAPILGQHSWGYNRQPSGLLSMTDKDWDDWNKLTTA